MASKRAIPLPPGPIFLLAAAAVFSFFFCPAPILAQDVVISEFLALGGDLLDEDGELSDWIEIYNGGASAVNLEGWYLSDDEDDLKKWRFPDTSLEEGQFLIVFASGKNRAEPGQEFHTNFRLSSSGEFLALVLPDGETVADGYLPAYPEQVKDISFGLPQQSTQIQLVPAGATVWFRIPVDGSDGGWRLPGFNDASWSEGSTGLGFGAGAVPVPLPDEPVNLSPLGRATQSSDAPAGSLPASLAIDDNYENFTHTAAGENLPATWEIDLGDQYTLISIILYNRADCCRSRLRDITVSILDGPGGNVIYESDLLNPENILGAGGLDGPEILKVDLLEGLGSAILGRVVRVVRTPDPDLSGTSGQGSEDEADVLSLAEVEVIGTEGAYGGLIETNVEAAMRGINASIYVRIPFALGDVESLEFLLLRMKYEDGFVAWLNGSEVAHRNAPAMPEWNSAATEEREADEALVFEEIDLSEHLDSLLPGTNVLAIQGLNLSADDLDFLILPELNGIPFRDEMRRYFKEPTPGDLNDSEGFLGFVADTRFSHDRGFYESPFTVEITTETPDAEIRYTLDGSVPSESNGIVYTGPLPISSTTTLRARAFLEGLEPTNVDTHTYIFIEDVISQSYAKTLEAGFPSRWGSTASDYGMSLNVVNFYQATIRDDLKSLPSMSIVMLIDDLFGSRGIYTNSTQHGLAWERPASVELIDPDGSDGFQVDCGIRIQGGWFRQHSGTKKHSFRLLFKDQYGPTRLRFPLFGKRAVDQFDTITLRAGANDGYSWDAARLTEQYTRDEFGRSLQRATGNAGCHGMFVHLYINGIYWGLYNPVERPDHAFSASYYGGEKEEWDAIHDGLPTNGDARMYSQMIGMTSAAGSSLANYQRLQGRNPDGTPNPSYPYLLDVQNYIDYLIVNLWGGNWDWPWKNWWACRDRTEKSTGFKFYCWDYENTMGNNRNRSPLTKNALLNDFSSAGIPHTNLRRNAEYRLAFADRVHRFFFHGGILTPESLIPRYADLASRVERAIVGESARWGDQHYSQPLTLREWTIERDWLLKAYLPYRSAIVLQQLRSAGLYPAVEAPAFNRHGGRVDPGFLLIITAPAGKIYYTLDGTDPRIPEGAVSPNALEVGEMELIELVPAGAEAKVLVPEDESLGLDWIEPEFNDTGWLEGSTGIGFDTGTDFDALIATDVEDLLYRKASSIYVRIPFDVDPVLIEEGALAMLLLKMKYDDGYAAYLNGERIASRNAPESLAWNSRATAVRNDGQAVEYEAASIAGALPLLRPGRNLLAIHGLNTSTTGGGDLLILPSLGGVPTSSAIPILETTVARARALVNDDWSALSEATFVIDVPIRVTEILYHPAPPPEDSPFDENDFEFIELQNIGETPMELSGVQIEGGILFDFAESDLETLEPGGIVVLVENLEAFASRYQTEGMLIAGQYRGRLANDGDLIVVRGPHGEAILDFVYDDGWYPETDGLGPSLVIADFQKDPSAWEDAASWHQSEFPLGSPGFYEPGKPPPPEGWQIPGDITQDGKLSLGDAVILLKILFLGGTFPLPCEGNLTSEANTALLDSNGDGEVLQADIIHFLTYLFLDGDPPARGIECARFPGCPDVCAE